MRTPHLIRLQSLVSRGRFDAIYSKPPIIERFLKTIVRGIAKLTELDNSHFDSPV